MKRHIEEIEHLNFIRTRYKIIICRLIDGTLSINKLERYNIINCRADHFESLYNICRSHQHREDDSHQQGRAEHEDNQHINVQNLQKKMFDRRYRN